MPFGKNINVDLKGENPHSDLQQENVTTQRGDLNKNIIIEILSGSVLRNLRIKFIMQTQQIQKFVSATGTA